VHPGEVLLEEFLKPMDISQYRLAKEMSVPPRRVNEIVLKKRGITADTALRLGRYFGTSEQFWLNLQSEYDLDMTRDRLGDRLNNEVVALRPAVSLSSGKPRSRVAKRAPAMHRST
jgi:addiction module HigA family antidote